MLHSERREDMPLDISVEGLARHALDDVSGQARAVIGIGRSRSRRVDPVGYPALQQRIELDIILLLEGDQVLDRFLKARRMRHQVEHRHRLALVGRNLEIDVGVDVGIEVDLAGLDLLHQRGPGKQLGD